MHIRSSGSPIEDNPAGQQSAVSRGSGVAVRRPRCCWWRSLGHPHQGVAGGRRRCGGRTQGRANGAAVGPDGKIYVCNNGGFTWSEVNGHTVPGLQPDDYTGGKIQRVDLETGEVDVLYDEVDGIMLRGPNDLVFDDTGGFWFTDHGKIRARQRDRGGLYYAKADGSEIREVVFPLDAPNGVGLSPEQDMLYVAETYQGRLYQWPLSAPGEIAGYFGPEHRGEVLADPEGGPAVRFAGRRLARERLRGHDPSWWNHKRHPRRRPPLHSVRRSAHHQHLFRRRRSRDRVCHAVGVGPAGGLFLGGFQVYRWRSTCKPSWAGDTGTLNADGSALLDRDIGVSQEPGRLRQARRPYGGRRSRRRRSP